MWDSVRSAFFPFSEPMEGKVAHMYQDHLGLVTVGVGNLIDSADAAWGIRDLGAPFFTQKGNGPEADESAVRAEWARVKNDPSLAGKHQLAAEVTDLRLTDDGIAALLTSRLESFESTLRQTTEFADIDGWPADAQLGLFSMAWAMGPGFAQNGHWPSFRGACSARDWLAAAANSVIGNGWLRKRNAVNRGLFRNAAYSVASGYDPSGLLLVVPGMLPTLRSGSTDAEFAGQGYDSDTPVTSLQQFLEWLGYPTPATGTFDEQTDSGVRAFQADEASITASGGGFTVDGIVGSTSWAALGFIVPRA